MSVAAWTQGIRFRAADAKARVLRTQAGARRSRVARAERPLADRTEARDVLLLSFPLFVELFMQIMMGNVNQLMLVSQGSEPAAAVGNALQILNIVTVVLSAMSTATTVLATRAVGRALPETRVSEVGAVALVVNGALSILITALLFVLWPQMLALLNVDPSIRDMASSFLLIVGASTVVQSLFFTFTALLRSQARVKDVMLASLAMNGVNVLVGASLVFGAIPVPLSGVEGVAVANVAARMIGLLVAFYLVNRHTCIHLSISLVKPFPWGTLRDMLRVGVPSSGEQLNYDLVQVVILSFINVLGTTVVAVKVYCSMVAGVAYLYSLALSQAMQIVLGYLFGSGRFDLVKRRVWMVDLAAVVLTTCVSAALWLNADTVLGFLTDDPLVRDLGARVLFIEMFLSAGRAVNIVMVRALVAVGDVKTPVAANVAFSWVFAVGGGYALGIGLGWGIVGMWAAMCVDEWLRAAFLVAAFARGRWRTVAEKDFSLRESADGKRVSESSSHAKGAACDLLDSDRSSAMSTPPVSHAPTALSATPPSIPSALPLTASSSSMPRSPVAQPTTPSPTPAPAPLAPFATPLLPAMSATTPSPSPSPSPEPRKPREPAASGVGALAALASADEGALPEAVADSAAAAIAALW